MARAATTVGLTGAVDLARMQPDYESQGLDPADADDDPLGLFARWLHQAGTAHLVEPSASVLSTVDQRGRPSARNVLVKGLSDGGFEFYTNYTSRKARHLEACPFAALTFSWLALHRQVCVAGRVETLTGAESDAYWALRPRGSQLGAWASRQSSTLGDRAELEARFSELEARFAGRPVPRPRWWGGYRLRPDEVEFWQGRPNRLHDRVRYLLGPAGTWERQRLAP
jgi:pyridoxamine 5'-phosphate oxidase